MPAVVRWMQKSKFGRVVVDVFDWYPSHLPKAERKLLRKLDCSILIFACLSFFAKFLDQSNITNAYVSGLKEDLQANGNALNYFNVSYYTAYVVGQIPFMYLQTKPSLAPYLLPTLEVIWAILTFCQSRMTKLWHVYLMRALIGFFEAPSFGGTHLILGSWYRKEELFKRAGVWFMGNSLGSMFSGYLQAAAYKNLSGVHGLAGWRWLFIIDGVITLPIAFIGFALFPGLPNSPKKWYMTDAEYELSSTRLLNEEGKSGNDGGLTFKVIKDALKKPMWWICVSAYICMIQSHYWTGYMQLWLKADHYTTVQVNIYPTFVNLIQAISSWLGTTLAASVSLGWLWGVHNAAFTAACVLLTVWDIPKALKFIAFYLGGASGMGSPILYSWINSTIRDSTAERGFIISSMMTAGYCTYIWIPIFTFPTVESPRFPKGYSSSIAFSVGLWGIVWGGMIWARRSGYGKQDGVVREDEESREGSTIGGKGSPSVEDVDSKELGVEEDELRVREAQVGGAVPRVAEGRLP
ncbi:hypothetical protein IAT38_001498 [Cryptococcus sp. DSM 104549]